MEDEKQELTLDDFLAAIKSKFDAINAKIEALTQQQDETDDETESTDTDDEPTPAPEPTPQEEEEEEEEEEEDEKTKVGDEEEIDKILKDC